MRRPNRQTRWPLCFSAYASLLQSARPVLLERSFVCPLWPRCCTGPSTLGGDLREAKRFRDGRICEAPSHRPHHDPLALECLRRPEVQPLLVRLGGFALPPILQTCDHLRRR